MEGQFKLLFDQMKIEMEKQTNIIFQKMDEKLEPLIKENKILKNKIEILEKKIEYFEKEKRNNNILYFGLDERRDSSSELFQRVQEIFKHDLKITLEAGDVSKIHRIGPIKENKIRPVLVSFANNWKKSEILKIKRNLKDGYITEDFPKEVLEKRRELKPKLIEERAKGNTAYIKYDQLVVKEGIPIKEKRKRDQLSSPDNLNQAKKTIVTNSSVIKENRKNAFDLMRPRSSSITNISNNSK